MSIRNFLANWLLTQPEYKLKPRAFFDFSHWETVSDWSKVTFPAGTLGLITKATEGKGWLDPTFVPYFQAFGNLYPQYFRGAYHYFVPNDITPQIYNFTTHVLDAGWKDGDLAILDAEYIPPPWVKGDTHVRGEQYAYQVKFFLDGIERELGVKPIIYWSRNVVLNMLDAKGNPPSWINDYWNWIAWYPFSAYIDANPWVPASRLPPGLRPERVAGWQYATNWVIPGINYDGVDVNTASQEFIDSLTATPPPVPEPFKPHIAYADITWEIDEAGNTITERIE